MSFRQSTPEEIEKYMAEQTPTINLEQNKGKPCKYSVSFLLCQESPICGGCVIWKEWLKRQERK